MGTSHNILGIHRVTITKKSFRGARDFWSGQGGTVLGTIQTTLKNNGHASNFQNVCLACIVQHHKLRQ
jgi:hypothetical protein